MLRKYRSPKRNISPKRRLDYGVKKSDGYKKKSVSRVSRRKSRKTSRRRVSRKVSKRRSRKVSRKVSRNVSKRRSRKVFKRSSRRISKSRCKHGMQKSGLCNKNIYHKSSNSRKHLRKSFFSYDQPPEVRPYRNGHSDKIIYLQVLRGIYPIRPDNAAINAHIAELSANNNIDELEKLVLINKLSLLPGQNMTLENLNGMTLNQLRQKVERLYLIKKLDSLPEQNIILKDLPLEDIRTLAQQYQGLDDFRNSVRAVQSLNPQVYHWEDRNEN